MVTKETIERIRGRLEINQANQADINIFLDYHDAVVALVEEASNEDFYGTEGYERRLGWDT